MNNKFKAEKVLHEIIRDLPEVKKYNDMLEHGLITFDDFLLNMITIVKVERMKAYRKQNN